MPAAPPAPATDLSKKHQRWFVLVGPTTGENPTEADVVDFLHPLSLMYAANSDVPMEAEFRYDLGKTGERLLDVNVLENWNRVITIWLGDDISNLEYCIFWGELSRQSFHIDEGGEFARITAAVNPHHFGVPLEGPQTLQAGTLNVITGGTFTVVHNPIVFNPRKSTTGRKEHERIDPNRVESAFPSPNEGESHWDGFFDPEAARTERAEDYADVDPSDDASRWTLATAVKYLQNNQIIDDEFIYRATEAHIDEIFEDAPELEDAAVPVGEYLPRVLTALLAPYGYGWTLRMYDDIADITKVQPQLVFFKRGEGTERKVYLQRPGEHLDLAASNVKEMTLEQDIASLANKIKVFGDYERKQVTIELYRGWVEGNDGSPLDLADLESGGDKNAYRLWVGNEGADYNELRTSIAPIPDEPLDLDDVFGAGNWVPKRRPMEDTLFIENETGRRVPPILEYYDETEEEWLECPPQWGARLLTDQIGVYFSADAYPDKLFELGAEARVRITGVIAGDKKITASVERDANSPNSRDVTLHLHLPGKYRKMSQQASGEFASVGVPHATITVRLDTVDDTTKMTDFAENVAVIEKAAKVTARVKLHDIHPEFRVGDLVTEVEGREINFNRYAESASEKRYPQLVGLVFDRENYDTTLILENSSYSLADTVQQAQQATDEGLFLHDVYTPGGRA